MAGRRGRLGPGGFKKRASAHRRSKGRWVGEQRMAAKRAYAKSIGPLASSLSLATHAAKRRAMLKPKGNPAPGYLHKFPQVPVKNAQMVLFATLSSPGTCKFPDFS